LPSLYSLHNVICTACNVWRKPSHVSSALKCGQRPGLGSARQTTPAPFVKGPSERLVARSAKSTGCRSVWLWSCRPKLGRLSSRSGLIPRYVPPAPFHFLLDAYPKLTLSAAARGRTGSSRTPRTVGAEVAPRPSALATGIRRETGHKSRGSGSATKEGCGWVGGRYLYDQ
jgi:hypothetical protein